MHENVAAVKELPEALPQGERILWQGAPEWRSLLRRAFHGRKLVLYFSAALGLRAASELWSGGSPLEALVATLLLLPIALFALGLVALLAWLTARASWYTITDRRVVMRIGIVLEITFNFPFKVIDNAGLRLHADGTGDIPLQFMPGEQIAYVHLWPHARPWHFRRTEPMLRCVADAARVAELLANSIAAQTGGAALPVRAAASPAIAVVAPPRGRAAANAA